MLRSGTERREDAPEMVPSIFVKRATSTDQSSRAWGHALALDEASTTPLFAQIAEALAADVRRGVLRPGDAIPGSRTLAEALGVHRNTVLAALRELEKQGWIRSERARGTFVSEALPELRARAPEATRGDAFFDVSRVFPDVATPVPPDALPLLGGVPDVRLVPTEALARAYRRALRAPRLLGYGDPAGALALRRALATMLAHTRGLAVEPDDVVVTRGSQMAIDLVARALLRPGDVVAVEALGYRPAWEALRASGATLVPVRVDRHGLDVARLAELAETTPLRAVYVTPHHQYPTTAVLGAPRRLALLELARRRRIAILEDDYDHELHYEGRPILPLASRAPRSVIYVGTLSKVLAPGLRLGWVIAPPPLREAIVAHRTYVDRQGDHVLEHAIAELAEDGELARHTLRMRRVYLARLDHFVSVLQETFGETLRFEVPRGGMALWAHARGVDVDAWAERAATRGVYVQTARRFTFDRRPRAALRLGFGALDETELGRAIELLAKAL